jgi:hypothetical protein
MSRRERADVAEYLRRSTGDVYFQQFSGCGESDRLTVRRPERPAVCTLGAFQRTRVEGVERVDPEAGFAVAAREDKGELAAVGRNNRSTAAKGRFFRERNLEADLLSRSVRLEVQIEQGEHGGGENDRQRNSESDPGAGPAAWIASRRSSDQGVGRAGQNFIERDARVADIAQALLGIFSQAACQKHADTGGRVVRQMCPIGIFLDDSGESVGDRLASKGHFATEHFVQDAAEGPDVRAAIDRFPFRLLGRHIRGGAQQNTRLRGHAAHGR